MAKLRVGFHVRSQGSFEKTVRRAAGLGADTCQIFSASPRMWRAKMPDPADIRGLLAFRARCGLTPVVIHDNYLINLASADDATRALSIQAFRGEVERALALGAEYLVMHPGSWKNQTVVEACRRFVLGLEEALDGLSSGSLGILLENTAGQGAALGSKFEELAALREFAQPRVGFEIGYCLDTCHCLAAGYDVANATGVAQTLREVDRTLSLDRVRVIHSNDSKAPFGSKVDRHAQIGLGYIGEEGFRALVRHTGLRDKPFILEVPFEEEGDEVRNMDRLRRLAED